MININTIYEQCCTETMKHIPDGFIDMTITSPPYDDMRSYNGNHSFQFQEIATSLYRVTKEGGVVVWIIGDQTKNFNETGTSFRHALYFKEIGFNLFDTMIYLKKPRGACGNNKGYWQTFEYMFVFSKGKPKTIHILHDRENKDKRDGDNGTKRLFDGTLKNMKRNGYTKFGRRTNVWEYNVGKGHSTKDDIAFKHPAIFPEKLAEDHILSWSNENEIVYDPFMGSGTTAKMSIIHNRNYLGSEINHQYITYAKERINGLKRGVRQSKTERASIREDMFFLRNT
ncbi:MAG: site-specific DNA-methyltransferase [Methylacidiphilales bacterium]|nr:site-specific DNA-methyltransferase [Candidatus Methylacidiphilales bacterium]